MTHVPLEEVAEINPPVPKSVLESNDSVAFLRMADISEQGEVWAEEERSISVVKKGYRYFERGDVLVAKITPCMENGKAAYLENLPTRVGFGSTEFHVIRPSSDLDGRYAFYMVWNARFRFVAERNMTGTAGQKRVPTDFLRRYTIPLPIKADGTPNVDEQRRIAAILDKADTIRRQRHEANRLSEEFLRSAFLVMFGDPVTNPKGWPKSPLGKCCSITTGNTPSRNNPDYYGDHIEWIKSDNINTDSHLLTLATECLSEAGMEVGRVVEADSILMTCIAGSRSSIGRVALADRKVAFNQQINALTPMPASNHKFIYVLLLLAQRLVQAVSTDSMKGLVSKGRLASVEIPLPPLPLQEQFAKLFDNALEMRHLKDTARDQAERLFHSLVQRAIRGEL